MIDVTDIFCGCGGSSSGAVAAGADVRIAINHWKLAVETHETNHPDALHDCADVSAIDPRRYPRTRILWASPECTNHSVAKGAKRHQRDQLNLYESGVLDPAAERSRATMWDVPRFAETHAYDICIVENVADASRWVMWPAWLHAMKCLGYTHRVVSLNSMFAGAPQSRDRIYVVFWREGVPAPDLEICPRAYCPSCEADVDGRQAWRRTKMAATRVGKYRQQYDYVCPECAGIVHPYYRPALAALDLSLPSQRIGDRKRPLRERTLARIQHGIDKYGNEPLVVVNYSPGYCLPTDQPLASVTTKDHHAVAQPAFLVEAAYGSGLDCRVRGLADPLSTLSTVRKTALVQSGFLMSYYGQDTLASLREAMGTITTKDRHALLTYRNVGGKDYAVQGIGKPLPTMVTNAQERLITAPEESGIDDWSFRMLAVKELQAGMGFEPGYMILGTKTDRTKQLGNAVTPPAAEVLLNRCIEALA